MKRRHTDEQIIAILREAVTGMAPIKTICASGTASAMQTFFR